MAHFAKLGVNGKVIAVHGLDNDQMLNADSVEDETVGQQRLQQIHGWPAAMWIKTSYNTRGGKYYNADGTEADDQSKALRGNYAGIGYTWDEDNEIFWPKQPHASWSKNTTTAAWDAPITYPSVKDDGADPVVWNYNISWNETLYQSDNTKGWEATKSNVDGSAHADADKTYDWNGSAWVERA
jgi:hypothetical protein